MYPMAGSELDSAELPVVSLDERRLLVRHRRGDPEAFAELVARFRAPIYGYLVRCGVDAASRDDLFQETFARVHGAAATYQADRPLKPWLLTITANLVRTHFRRQRVQALVFPGQVAPEPPDHSPDAFDAVDAAETAQWLEEAICCLPLAQREVLILSCVEQLPHDEIAQVLDLPVGTVKTHLHRGRRALAEGLARRRASQVREVSR